MGKLGVSSLLAFLDDPTLDTHDGIDLELSHDVPRVEQKLFDPLRHPVLRWVVRGVLFSRHAGEPKNFIR